MANVEIYSDGSYFENLNAASWGVVVWRNGYRYDRHAGVIPAPSQRNLTAEIKAMKQSLLYVQNFCHPADSILLNYDLKLIQPWLTGHRPCPDFAAPLRATYRFMRECGYTFTLVRNRNCPRQKEAHRLANAVLTDTLECWVRTFPMTRTPAVVIADQPLLKYAG